MHRLLAGPAGWLFEAGWFDRLRMALLPREFRMARARALALAHPEPDDFLDALALESGARARLSAQSARALAELDRRRAALRLVQARWDDVMWGGMQCDAASRAALENERRTRSEEVFKPARLFRFLSAEREIAPVGYDVPAPPAALAKAAPWLARPGSLYAAPDPLPRVERSAAVPGPVGPEYLIRCRSPSPFTLRDTVTARVYDPPGGSDGAPAFIFGSGLGMLNDLIRYWPEEDYIARRLAGRGIRVVLPESPWHGRRELRGCYSGEPYLARAPAALFELFSAQTQETAQLIAWARSEGAPRVGAGGVSLGALVTQQIAGHCGAWPAVMRPDMVFLGAGTSQVGEAVTGGDLSQRLGLDAAVRDGGWTDRFLRELAPLLDPPGQPGVAPGAILAYLGRRDRSAPFEAACQSLDTWRVPQRNRIIHDGGHISLYLSLIRSTGAADRIAGLLASPET
ncbi:hypothetical protein ACUXV3_13415 [Roseobacteraceae bacterium NS-SX3]